jgi:hypothetical protein
LKLVIEFEVARWQDLKDRISIILEEELIIIGLIFGFNIGKALGSQETLIVALSLESLD